MPTAEPSIGTFSYVLGHSDGPPVSTADSCKQRTGSSSGWCSQTALHFASSNYF